MEFETVETVENFEIDAVGNEASESSDICEMESEPVCGRYEWKEDVENADDNVRNNTDASAMLDTLKVVVVVAQMIVAVDAAVAVSIKIARKIKEKIQEKKAKEETVESEVIENN